MVMSLLVVPAVTGSMLARRLASMMLATVGVALTAIVIGLYLSFHADLPHRSSYRCGLRRAIVRGSCDLAPPLVHLGTVASPLCRVAPQHKLILGMSLVYNRKSRCPTWCRRWSVGSHLIELALFLSLPFVFLACTSNPPVQNADFGQFVGSYEEVIELPGPLAPGFSDAEFVQLLRPDDIPPIYSPVFVPASKANLPDDELVIGLAIGDDARAYPAGILFFREMVNDRVNGIPVLVSWCPRCYTALVHDRRIDGEPLVFGNQGALYQGGHDLV